MKLKTLATILLPTLLLLGNPTATLGHRGENSGRGGDENRVRVEVRANEDEAEENQVRVEIRGEDANLENALNLLNQQNLPDEIGRVRIDQRNDRVRVEVRAPEVEDIDEAQALPNIEIKGSTFEITGEVTATGSSTVTIGGKTIIIDPNQVQNFEQEGTIEVGEVIKVEGIVKEDGTLLAREIKANGVEVRAQGTVVSDNSLKTILEQILALLRSIFT